MHAYCLTIIWVNPKKAGGFYSTAISNFRINILPAIMITHSNGGKNNN